jgi:DNA mismatch repair protein MutS2
MNQAKEEAKQLVRDANSRIEQTIREIRASNAGKDETRELRRELDQFQTSLKPEYVPQAPAEDTPEIKVIGGEIEAGDLVRIKGQTAVGEVIDLNVRNKEAIISIGLLKSTLKLNRLEKISRKEYRAHTVENTPRMQGVDINEKAANFSYQLDLRGKRGEEALQEVDGFIDNAIMLGSPELRIVHGKGDGILRTLVRNHLRSYKQVQSLEDEHADRGGAGVTVVRMK